MTDALFAREEGAKGGPIVFLHGFGGCSGLWSHVASGFAAENRTFAYDLPGHGGSVAWPDAGPAKIAVRAVLADLETRGLEQVHLVGHSMGGAVAALIALAKPERVASLTLLAPGGFGEEINGALLRRYAAAMTESEIEACLKAMAGPKGLASNDAVGILAAMRGRVGQTERLIEIAAAISRDDRQGVIPRAALATLGMQVSVVWGMADPLLPYRQTEGLPPTFVLHSAEGVGHMLAEEAPELVTDIVRRTIAGSIGATGS